MFPLDIGVDGCIVCNRQTMDLLSTCAVLDEILTFVNHDDITSCMMACRKLHAVIMNSWMKMPKKKVTVFIETQAGQIAFHFDKYELLIKQRTICLIGYPPSPFLRCYFRRNGAKTDSQFPLIERPAECHEELIKLALESFLSKVKLAGIGFMLNIPLTNDQRDAITESLTEHYFKARQKPKRVLASSSDSLIERLYMDDIEIIAGDWAKLGNIETLKRLLQQWLCGDRNIRLLELYYFNVYTYEF